MKTLILTLIICTSLTLSAQSKYFIYFKDKGVKKDQALYKGSAAFLQAEKLLSERSIERRKKNMGEDNYITYEDIPVYKKYVDEIENLGIQIKHKLKWFNSITAYLNDDQFNKVSRLEFVEKVEPVKLLKNNYLDDESVNVPAENYKSTHSTENVYSYGSSFIQADFCDVPAVHNLGITGQNIRIGIMDSGFKWKQHHALKNSNVIDEHDFVNGDGVTANQAGDVSSQHDHGTKVFSVIGGFSQDTLVGIAFSSEFVLAKTEDIPTETHVEEDNYAAALEWFDQLGVDVTNSSVGYNTFDPGEPSYSYSDMDGRTAIVTQAENLAFSRGIATVTSAGNERSNSWQYINAPADAFNTIAVGATNSDGSITYFSSKGPTYDGRIKPEVVNLGSSVRVATPSGSYGWIGGTSFSSPLTAGIVSLLLSAHPHLKNTQVRKIMLEAGDRSENPDNDFGYGIISAERALSFPNLSQNSGSYMLHKIFINPNGVTAGTANISYSVNGSDIQTNSLTANGNQKFKYDLTGFNMGDTISFYFNYTDTLGNNVREPESKKYKLVFGNLNVLLAVDDIPFVPENYVLEQNYPNPFNPETTIRFFPLKEEFAEVFIYDILGQKIKNLFSGIATVGENEVNWDGTNDAGLRVPSGVYFYSLNIGGSQLTKKMMLIK